MAGLALSQSVLIEHISSNRNEIVHNFFQTIASMTLIIIIKFIELSKVVLENSNIFLSFSSTLTFQLVVLDERIVNCQYTPKNYITNNYIIIIDIANSFM